MNRFFKTLLIAMAVVPAFMSCSKDSDSDYPQWRGWITVHEDDNFYYFSDEDGKTYYPGDVRRVGYYNAKDRDGKRVYIEFNFLNEQEEGYDYNIALYYIDNILTKTVEVAETEDDVKEAGDGRLAVNWAEIDGRWLDIVFSLTADYGSTHKMTLLDNRTQEAPETMPEGYQYLEFRQLPDNFYNGYLGRGYVSYDLGEYAPKVSGKKGLYIRIRDLHGEIKHLSIKYTAPEENQALHGNKPVPAETAVMAL